MNLGDVSEQTVPKLMLLASPRAGGSISARSFIPHRAHASIGVLGAVTVATACLVKDSVAAPLAEVSMTFGRHLLSSMRPVTWRAFSIWILKVK